MGYVDDINKTWNLEEYPLYPKFENTMLRIELSNICNDKCIFCINPKFTRKRLEMSNEFVYSLIDEAASLGIKELSLFVNGEPFVSKELPEYIRYAKSKGVPYVFITTNGGLATHDKIAAVMDAGLDSIKFSINAGSKKTYIEIHGRDDYEKVMDNLKFAHNYKKENKLNCKVLSSFIVTKYTQNEIDIQYNNLEPYVDDMAFFYTENWGGYLIDESNDLRVEIENERVPKYEVSKKLPCAFLFDQIIVSCEGFLICCCNDGFNYLAVSNVKEKGIKGAWYSEEMVNFRKRHLSGDVIGTQCFNCIHDCQSKVAPLNMDLYLKGEGKV